MSRMTEAVGAALADDAGSAPTDSPTGHSKLTDEQLAALAALRKPVPEHLLAVKPVDVNAKWNGSIGKFVTKDGRELTGRKCGTCHQFLPERHSHLTYAGHAAITDRLLEADPTWSWEPVTEPELLAVLPRFEGGMWIRLTVAGITRLGYGDAAGKSGHNAIKEIIGDALRNAAMRFGLGLELWHKGDLHADAEAAERAEIEAREASEKLAAAQAIADTAAGVDTLERVAELAEQARADGLAEVTVQTPDGNVGALVAYLRHRHRQLAAAAADEQHDHDAAAAASEAEAAQQAEADDQEGSR